MLKVLAGCKEADVLSSGSPASLNAHFSAVHTKGRRTRKFPVFAVNKAVWHS